MLYSCANHSRISLCTVTENMKYKEFLPHPSLQDYVKCFWILEREYTPEDPHEDVTPDAFVELMFNFGAPYVLQPSGTPDREMPTAFIVGLLRMPLLFRSSGTVRLVSTRFYAWGTVPFLNITEKTSDNLAVTLDHQWSDLANKVSPRVHADDYDGAVAVVEDFLIGKLLTASFDLKEIQIAAQMLHHQKGQFRITELADQMNVSTRQLQRRFQDVVGVSPKALARAIRFEEIRKRLMFEPDSNLTDLAYEFGYTDQAHFIHDFKDFAERAPSEFAKEMRALQKALHDHDNVVFLQFPERQPE